MGKRTRQHIKVQSGTSNYPARKSSLSIIGACGLIIFLITGLIYTPAINNGFVNWDDNLYVYENSYIYSLNLHSLYWMLTSFHATNWHPLTWLSHAIDYAVWGLNPFGHHLTSIILHGMNSFLVFLLVMQLMLRGRAMNQVPTPSPVALSLPAQSLIAAGVAALLFGVHPLHVESVAWVAERKDVLCAFFFLLTLCSYLFYTSSVDKTSRRAWFIVCMVLETAALMAKPMAVTLPLVLAILDVYPLRQITFTDGTHRNLRVMLEKVPFFFLSAISTILTILAQHAGGALESFERLPLHFRLVNAIHAPLFYLAKIVWPVGLVPFYPFPKTISFFDLPYSISVILTISITVGCIWLWKRGRKLFLVIWAYYLITLLPVVGFIQVGGQAAADRYIYLPGVSIFLLAGIGASWLSEKGSLLTKKVFCGALLAVLVLLSQVLIQQIKIWQDSETLWRHVIGNFPKSVHFAYNNLGVVYGARGMHDKAIEAYEKALAISPSYVKAHNNLGHAYFKTGKYYKAIDAFERALAGNPHLVEAHNNLGSVYLRTGKYDKAIAAYEKALVSNPNVAAVYLNLGNTYYAKGMLEEAITHYKKAIAINPNFAEAYNDLGNVYYKIGSYDLAGENLDKALALGYKVDPKLLESVKRDRSVR